MTIAFVFERFEPVARSSCARAINRYHYHYCYYYYHHYHLILGLVRLRMRGGTAATSRSPDRQGATPHLGLARYRILLKATPRTRDRHTSVCNILVQPLLKSHATRQDLIGANEVESPCIARVAGKISELRPRR